MLTKSQFGQEQVFFDLTKDSSLLNGSEDTDIIYRLGGFDDEKMRIANEESKHSRMSKKLLEHFKNVINIEYTKYQSPTFYMNLMIIDSGLPKIVADALLLHYFHECTTTVEMLDKIKGQHDYLGVRDNFLVSKYRNFLYACALGMLPSEPWDDRDDPAGGYVIVLPSGEHLAFSVFNMGHFKRFLVQNTKFERASTSRHKYMSVFKDGSEFFIKLNLQIRFTK